jgi:hypothetical protein
MRKVVLRAVCASIAAAAGFAAAVRADVTIQQNTSLEVASMIRMHGLTTTTLTADKKREDIEAHCEGLMSLLCGNVQSGDIVRLDKNVTWRLEPKKKRYLEQAFATPEELAAMRAKMQANLEKMRSCPVSQKQEPIDKSKCEMAPPKFEVHKTDTKASIAGHDTQLTSAAMTETCTNKETGEVCDTIVAVDVWLTQDKLPGTADRTVFDSAYSKKLGLPDTAGIMRGQAARFLAPYQSQIKELTDKSAEFKGQPMKTSFRVLMGGRQCSSTKSKDDASNGAAGSDNPVAAAAQAGKALGSLVGGMFHKKKADDSADAAKPAAAPGPAATPAGPTTPDPYAQYYSQMAAFSVETVAINSDAVPADRFEVPADWTRETPKAAKDDEEYTCPKT